MIFEGSFYELSDFLYRVRTLVSVNNGRLRATGRLFTVRTLSFVEAEQGFPQIRATLGGDGTYVYGTGAATPPGAPPPAAQPPAAQPPAARAASRRSAPASCRQPAAAPPAGASAAGAS